MDQQPMGNPATDDAPPSPPPATRSLLLNPPLWLVFAVFGVAIAATPLDWPIRSLVGPQTRDSVPVITPTGEWHNALYQPIHFAYFFIVPLVLWTLIIIALPNARKRWVGVGIVLSGFVLRGVFEFLEQHGQTWAAMLDSSLPILVLLLLLRQFPNGKLMWYAYFVPVVLTQVLTHALKLSVGRVRPKVAQSPFEFHPFHPWKGDYSSFPSGHTSAATAMALLLAVYIPRFRWLFAALAVIVASERVVTNAHWLSDVIGGAAIGIAAVWIGRRMYTPDHYVSQR